MRLDEFVHINPSVSLEKAKTYPCVMMDEVEPSRRYVYGSEIKKFTGGGAKFRDGDTLFARITPSLENGKIAQFVGQKGTLGFGSTEFIVFRARDGLSDPGFIFYLAKTDIVRKPAEKSMFGASGRQRADVNVVKEIEVPSPPLSTQRKIAAILSAYDDLIENNTRRIQILQEMAQAIYSEWFVHFRFPGHENVKMVDSGTELGEVPEGWEAGIIRDVCDNYKYGYTAKAQKENVGPKFLRITDIVPYLIDWESVPYCEIEEKEIEKYLLQESDIVVARTGATTGYAKRIDKRHSKAIFASYLVRLQIKPNHSRYLYGVIVESDEYKQFIKTNLGGAAQPSANAQVLTSYPVVIPPQELQKSFDDKVQSLLDYREILQQKNTNLRTTRDLLLPRLISGEINVSDLAIHHGGSE